MGRTAQVSRRIAQPLYHFFACFRPICWRPTIDDKWFSVGVDVAKLTAKANIQADVFPGVVFSLPMIESFLVRL
ncbi:MAG: hypothetical protein M5U34_22435 [Chloroflexi bacterium]|nr:hypothetical protein [Chloroflexota bacterium]